MKYNAPYGNSNNDAPYVNGNPSTGTMGSIPPAESIEHPQREIVNFITDSAVTPSGTDLRQMSKAIQSGKVNYCVDAGSPNFLAITPVPALTAYTAGQQFRISVAHGNTGPMQLNVSGLGWKTVIHGDQTAMVGGEVYTGQIIEVSYNGTNWQMTTGGVSGSLVMMTTPRDFYCNSITGDDSLYDGTQATVDAPNAHGPFKTLRRALTQMSKFNLSGFPFTIHLADGTYSETTVINAPVPNGSGDVIITGNTATPNLVKLFNSGNGSCITIKSGSYIFDGVCFQATQSTPSDVGVGLNVVGAGLAWLKAVGFYACPNFHMVAASGGSISVFGPIGIYGGAAVAHVAASGNGSIAFWNAPLPTLTIYNPVTFSAFANAANGGQMAQVYAGIVNPANVTGNKYLVVANGVIDTHGAGVNYLPGTVAGFASTGGQYV